VTTSEQVAWQMLAELGDRDRRLVEAWQQLGNDLTTSLLNIRRTTFARPIGRSTPIRVPRTVRRRRAGAPGSGRSTSALPSPAALWMGMRPDPSTRRRMG
jgi:hypothetical protein